MSRLSALTNEISALSPFPAPHALAASVTAVIHSHPYSADGTPDADSKRLQSDAEALWARLARLDAIALAREIDALRPFELRLLALTARAQLHEDARRGVLAVLLMRREIADASGLAWDAWLASDGDRAFRDLAVVHANEAGANAADTWRTLAMAARPSEAAARLWLAGSGPLVVWCARPIVSLSANSLFLTHVRRQMLLTERIVSLDHRETSETMAQWAALLLPAGDRDAWYATFLNETATANASRRPPHRWPADHAVCTAILDRYREPSARLPFWEGVSPGARAAFALWRTDNELTRLLGGENDRVAFWRRYLTQMRRLERNANGTVAFLYFDGWVAVQFVLSGHATFLMAERVALGWRHLPDSEVYQIALDLRRSRKSAFLGSYTHQGFTETWQRQAGEVVDGVFRLMTQDRTAP